MALIPPVTASERETWAEARALQRTDAKGQPAEGWPARINAMKADGRLVLVGNAWYRRD